MAIVGALLPVFALIVLGYCLQRYRFPDESFWPLAGRLTYWVLMPMLLINEVANAALGNLALLPFAAVLVGSLLTLSLALVVGQLLFRLNHPAFTSVFQGSIRPNTYVGLVNTALLYPTDGPGFMALATAICVPLVNLLSVAVFAMHGVEQRRVWRHSLQRVATNPLILACVVGIGVHFSGLPPGGVVRNTIAILGRAALPLGLLTVGAGLKLQALHGTPTLILRTSALKLLLLPLLTAGACLLLGVQGIGRDVVILYAALPGAPAAYILARQLGGDSELMAGILAAETILAALTMPLLLPLLW